MSDAYGLWKTLHVISATVLFGTGIGIAFFCWFGTRYALARGDLGSLRLVLRFTVLADAVFTAPAIVVQLLTGAVLLNQLGWKWGSPWALTALGLFVFVGACWLPVVWIQIRLARWANQATELSKLPIAFAGLFKLWFVLGTLAFPAVLCLIYLMVTKPLAVV